MANHDPLEFQHRVYPISFNVIGHNQLSCFVFFENPSSKLMTLVYSQSEATNF